MVRRRLVAGLVIGAGVLLAASAGLATGRFDGVQAYWEDLLQPGLTDQSDVVVVAIDRSTLAAAGATWPWDRDGHAELLDAIGGGSPAVVVYDVLFAGERAGDDAMAAAMARTPTVIGSGLTLALRTDGPPTIVDEIAPVDELAAAAVELGHLNVSVSAESGVVRSLPLYALDERGIAVPSVALAAVAVADGATLQLTERPGGIQVGTRFIPLDNGELRISWSNGLRASSVIPAIDVLSGAVDPGVFDDRIVFVGVTEPTLGDQHLVPIDRSGETSGVILLANATNTILTNGYVAAASTTKEILLLAIVVAAVTALFMALRLTVATLGALCVLAAVVLLVNWRFAANGELWNLVWPTIAIVLAAVAGTGWRYFSETRHRRRAWNLFATYVPASVVAQMEDPRRLASVADGVRGEVTVLFCDLRGFTPVAATLQPSQVRRLLDCYYDYAVSIIHAHGGTVMQFVGDEVFGVFGVPIPDDADATRAVRSALTLQSDLARLHDVLDANGLPVIRFGIGIHRGDVVAAHVGTVDRRQYSVVGDTVNVGSRLCSQAAAGEVVASAAALASLGNSVISAFTADGTVALKGVAEPVAIWRARCGGLVDDADRRVVGV